MSAASAPVNLVKQIASIKASSVLNGDGQQYGAKLMLTDNQETCWNSDQGKQQWIVVTFKQPVDLTSIAIVFQGGFVGNPLRVEIPSSDPSSTTKWITHNTFEPADVNKEQRFDVSCPHITSLRLFFPGSTDFYGRVTIYTLALFGHISSPSTQTKTSSTDASTSQSTSTSTTTNSTPSASTSTSSSTTPSTSTSSGPSPISADTLWHHLLHGSVSFISAYNPQSTSQSHATNEQLHTQLLHDLDEMKCTYHEVESCYDGKPEVSVMIPHTKHVTREMLEKLSSKYQQETILHIDAGVHELLYVTGDKKGKYHPGQGYRAETKDASQKWSLKRSDGMHIKTEDGQRVWVQCQIDDHTLREREKTEKQS